MHSCVDCRTQPRALPHTSAHCSTDGQLHTAPHPARQPCTAVSFATHDGAFGRKQAASSSMDDSNNSYWKYGYDCDYKDDEFTDMAVNMAVDMAVNMAVNKAAISTALASGVQGNNVHLSAGKACWVVSILIII